MKDTELFTRFNYAVKLEKDGESLKALQEYLYILRKDKKNRRVYVNLGALYSRMNKLKQAMRCYKAALTLGSDYITHFNIGCIYYRLKSYKKAVIHLEKSRVNNEGFIMSTLVIGLCYSKLHNIKAAKVNFIDVLKKKPNHRVALTALSLILYNEGRYDDSVKLLNRIIVSDSNNLFVRELKHSALNKTGNFDESVSEIKEIKKISNGYKMYDAFISSVSVDIYDDKYGTLDDKIVKLNQSGLEGAEELIPLSLCYLFKGETDKAIEYLYKAKKIHSEN